MKKHLLGIVTIFIFMTSYSQVEGTWKISSQAAAIGVGPGQGDISWWSNTIDDVTIRACFFDDKFVFNGDGSFENVMNSETWLEYWQGISPDQCGTPIAPHDGSNPATWVYDTGAGTLTLNGTGAHLGLAKVVNGSELTDPSQAPASITYHLTGIGASSMTIDIEIDNGGWWRFIFEKEIVPNSNPPIPPHAAEDVISIYSDEYTDISGIDYDPDWSQQTIVTVDDPIAGNFTLKYENLDYQGTDWNSNPQDVSYFEYLHVDFWTNNATNLGIYLISGLFPYLSEVEYEFTLNNGNWVSVDIPLSYFSNWGVALNDARQFKTEGDGDVWIDNLYFWKLPAPEIVVDLKVFLEGPFILNDMNNNLNPLHLPLNQPYNSSPWDYSGSESVTSIPSSDIIDWLLIEVRDAPSAEYATSETMVAQQAAFLLSNGIVVALDGSSNLIFNHITSNNLFIVVSHRNHLSVMSSNALNEVGGIYSYDFTDELSKAYLDGQISLEGGLYGMIAGDSDGKGTIDNNDIDECWNNDAGEAGYLGSDLNMDSEINNVDKNEIWEDIVGSATSVDLKCGFNIYDNRDGQSYKTIKIGNQCWMAENLNIGEMIIWGPADNDTIEKFCYDNNIDNCNIYGGLYNWDELMEYISTESGQGICPVGWHVPTDGEWCIMENEVDAGVISCDEDGWRGIDAGGNLKETGITHWNSPNIGATNSSGFTSLGAGYRNYLGDFGFLGEMGSFWTSTTIDGVWKYRRGLEYNTSQIFRYSDNTAFEYSVRCIKD